MKHTNLPWQQNTTEPAQICDADGVTRGCAPIAYTLGLRGERVANAAFIVKACNTHYELIESLKVMIKAFKTYAPQSEHRPLRAIYFCWRSDASRLMHTTEAWRNNTTHFCI